MTKVIFSKYAKLELNDATNFYEIEFEGLGQVFKEEVNTSIKRITQYPEAWSTERGDIIIGLIGKDNSMVELPIARGCLISTARKRKRAT